MRARLLFCVLVMLFTSRGEAQEIIVNPTHSASSLPQSEARAIFAMRQKTWPDGTPIVVFVLPDDYPLHKRFSKNVLGMFPHQFRRIWDRMVFSGTGQAPNTVSGPEEMRQRVADTPGAIGYLDKGDIDETVRPIGIE